MVPPMTCNSHNGSLDQRESLSYRANLLTLHILTQLLPENPICQKARLQV